MKMKGFFVKRKKKLSPRGKTLSYYELGWGVGSRESRKILKFISVNPISTMGTDYAPTLLSDLLPLDRNRKACFYSLYLPIFYVNQNVKNQKVFVKFWVN